MAAIDVGSEIRIPCQIKPGPFSGERLISFDTIDGPVSGFVQEQELIKNNGTWLIKGLVKKVESNHIVVRVKGSFFTTNGIASISKEMAIAA